MYDLDFVVRLGHKTLSRARKKPHFRPAVRNVLLRYYNIRSPVQIFGSRYAQVFRRPVLS